MTYKWCGNSCRVTDSKLQSRRNSPLSVARIVTRKPSKRQSNNNIQPHRSKEASKVSNSRRRSTNKDSISNSTNKSKSNSKHSSLLRSVRKPCHDDIRDSTHRITRNRQRLNLRIIPISQTSNNRRQKGAVAVENGIAAKLSNAEKPDLPVF